MKKSLKITVFTLFITFIFTGCSNNNIANPSLVTKYNATKSPVLANQTRMNIIRPDSFYGAGKNIYISCNNKTYSIANNSYISCITESDLNTIQVIYNNGVLIPSYHLMYNYYVDGKFGSDIFLYQSMSEVIKEIDSDYGKTLIIEAGDRKGNEINNLFSWNTQSFSLLNPSQSLAHTKNIALKEYLNGQDSHNETTEDMVDKMSKIQLNNFRFDKTLMKVDDTNISVSEDESRIILFRNKDNGSTYLGIWGQDKFIGDVGVESYIDYRTKEKKITFISYYHDFREKTIALEKGKTYYLNVDFDFGWNTNTIEFNEVSEDIFNKSAQEFCKISLDNEKITPLMRKRLDAGLEIIQQTTKQVALTVKINNGNASVWYYKK